MTEYRYSERGVIRPGDTFRARGGSTYHGRRVGPRGRFRAVGIETDRRGTYIVAYQVDRHGLPTSGTTLLYVSGRPWRMRDLPEGWIVRPYRVAKCRQS